MANQPTRPPRGGAPGRHSAYGSALQAIATGLVIDLVGSALIAALLSLIYAMHLSQTGMTDAQIRDALDNLPADSAVSVLSQLLGAACSVAGGYACARVAGRDEYRCAGAMATISVLLLLLLTPDDAPIDLALLQVLCEIACVLLGAKYGREYNERRRRAEPPP
ncbi:MAG TPA: hypothetical protein VF457_10335, partial [Burkholderiaceae bacterium]